MPRGDGTGPMGMGPMTGRSAGYCAGYGVPGFMNPIPDRGFGRGRGFWGYGRGFGRGMAWRWGCMYPGAIPPYSTAVSPHEEVEILKEQAQYFSKALDEINKRISELEEEKK